MGAPERRFVSDDSIGQMPFGWMSLLDVINYRAARLTQIFRWLTQQEDTWRYRAGLLGSLVEAQAKKVMPLMPDPDEYERTRKWLEQFAIESNELELVGSKDRAERFMMAMRRPMTTVDYATEFRVLREALEAELQYIHFYHYPRRAAERVLEFEKKWGAILAPDRFPSCRDDAEAATDCWALGHGTACVFHLMRVAEHGLRAVARERRVKLPKSKPIDFAQWGDIIKALKAKADALANAPSKHGHKREVAVAFYRGIIGELEAFRDVYRNPVDHSRATYDQSRAESVLNHVHGFMERLSERLGEQVTRQIAWGIR
jgi:hypothetical protein